MALHAFLEKSCDVVILEVCVGRKYERTNFISKPVCVGIPSLGLEHQSVLGSTLEEIADEKAGIIKKYCQVFMVNGLPQNIADILREHASSVGCRLEIVKPFENLPALEVDDGGNSRLNASLAFIWRIIF